MGCVADKCYFCNIQKCAGVLYYKEHHPPLAIILFCIKLCAYHNLLRQTLCQTVIFAAVDFSGTTNTPGFLKIQFFFVIITVPHFSFPSIFFFFFFSLLIMYVLYCLHNFYCTTTVVHLHHFHFINCFAIAFKLLSFKTCKP